ncbi:hypothetical protein [Desulfosporosinus sp. SB140]|uniref:hypothetical protein n=1 Tax=Desulfosporosinus paludis TaxID=3115649 RepID=UPI00388CFA1C
MQTFTVKQSYVMAKVLRDVIHAYGLSKTQLTRLTKEFGITEASTKGMEIQLIRALNNGEDLDWSKKRCP